MKASCKRLKEASVSASLKASNIRIVDSAEPAREAAEAEYAAESGRSRNPWMGAGMCAAFFQERLDRPLKGTDDVERVLGLASRRSIPLFHN